MMEEYCKEFVLLFLFARLLCERLLQVADRLITVKYLTSICCLVTLINLFYMHDWTRHNLNNTA